jgi:hypothetical protein
VIEFVHVSPLGLEICLPPEHLPQFWTILLTFVHVALAMHGMLFQFRLASTHFLIRRHVSCFDRKVVSLLCSPRFLELADLDEQLSSTLLIRPRLLFKTLSLCQQLR